MRTALAALALTLGLAVQATAIGGMCVEDLVVKNDGATVFADNFDDGNITDWTSTNDASVFCAGESPGNCFLRINRTANVVASAYHRVSIPRAGTVELSAWVWLPKPSEQFTTPNSTTFTYFYLTSGEKLASGSTPDVHGGPTLRSGEKAYRVQVGQQYGSLNKATAGTRSPVIQPETWTYLTIRIDKSIRRARALVNGKEVCSVLIDNDDFPSIGQISVWGWLGDGPRSNRSTTTGSTSGCGCTCSR